jgi:hypothetical protein
MGRFDFKKMEDRISLAYAKLVMESKKDKPSEDAKTELYKSIKDLADAVLQDRTINTRKMNKEEIAYNYSVDLYTRLITGALSPKKKDGTAWTHLDRFAWNEYIRKNIRWTIEHMGEDTLWSDVITELDALPNEEALKETTLDRWYEEEDSLNTNIDRDKLSVKIYKYVQTQYQDETINRLWPLASELYFRDGDKVIPDNLPDHLTNFMRISLGGARRLSKQYNIRFPLTEVSVKSLKKAEESMAFSTLFLSETINENIINRSLLLACDINTLYTLSHLEGGNKLEIPTLRQLESVQAAVKVVSKMIIEGQNFPDLRYEKGKNKLDELIDLTIEEFELIFANKKDTKFIASKMIETYNLHPHDIKGDPTIDLLIVASKALTSVAARLPDVMDKGIPLKDRFKIFQALSSMQSKLLIRTSKTHKNIPEKMFADDLKRAKNANVIEKLRDYFEKGLDSGAPSFSVNKDEARIILGLFG